jgi:hypothetical protein
MLEALITAFARIEDPPCQAAQHRGIGLELLASPGRRDIQQVQLLIALLGRNTSRTNW